MFFRNTHIKVICKARLKLAIQVQHKTKTKKFHRFRFKNTFGKKLLNKGFDSVKHHMK